MTEHNKSTETVNNDTVADTPNNRQTKPSSEQKRSGLIGSAIAIAIIIAIGGGIYYFTQQSNTQLANENSELKKQLSELIEQQKADRQRLDSLVASQSALSSQAREYEDQLNRRMQELQAHVNALSSSDVKS